MQLIQAFNSNIVHDTINGWWIYIRVNVLNYHFIFVKEASNLKKKNYITFDYKMTYVPLINFLFTYSTLNRLHLQFL